eukprot:snap_masked-scaffold_5-processed-gene-17.34-mRNA-1 protein AED:0.71 eAED:0.72 QI:0/0/0/1/1/1/2/0/251
MLTISLTQLVTAGFCSYFLWSFYTIFKSLNPHYATSYSHPETGELFPVVEPLWKENHLVSAKLSINNEKRKLLFQKDIGDFRFSAEEENEFQIDINISTPAILEALREEEILVATFQLMNKDLGVSTKASQKIVKHSNDLNRATGINKIYLLENFTSEGQFEPSFFWLSSLKLSFVDDFTAWPIPPKEHYHLVPMNMLSKLKIRGKSYSPITYLHDSIALRSDFVGINPLNLSFVPLSIDVKFISVQSQSI